MNWNGINSFSFYFDYYNLIDTLPLNDKKEIAVAILDYVFTDKEPNLKGHNQAIFNTLKAQICKSKNKSKCAKKDNQTEIKTKSNENQIDNQNEIKRDNKTSILNNININTLDLEKKSNRGMGEERKKTFIKPTVEEIKEYCRERHNKVDANHFYDFYESKGWFVGKNKMKDWKACVRTWERSDSSSLPNWFDKPQEQTQISDEDRQELESLLGEFK